MSYRTITLTSGNLEGYYDLGTQLTGNLSPKEKIIGCYPVASIELKNDLQPTFPTNHYLNDNSHSIYSIQFLIETPDER